MGPPVQRPRQLGVPGVQGLIFAITHRREPGRAHPETQQIVPRRLGPLLAQRQVVLRGPALVGVPLDGQGEVRVLGQKGRDGLKRPLRLVGEVVQVEGEVDVRQGRPRGGRGARVERLGGPEPALGKAGR